MRRLTPYLVLAVMVLGAGLGIGLGLSEAPPAPASAGATGVLVGGLEPTWPLPIGVKVNVGGLVTVSQHGHVVARSCDVGGRGLIGFHFTLPAGTFRVSANGAHRLVSVKPGHRTMGELVVEGGGFGRAACE